MKRTGLARRTRALVIAAVLLGCGPTFVFPGGALEGPVKPAPADWSFTNDIDTIQLETRPEDPYSVNIGCAVVDGRIYISAGDNRAAWVEHIEQNPEVRLRVAGILYELRAERVPDGEPLAAFGRAWTEKVPFGRDPTTLDVAYVYRLEARSPAP